MKKHLLLLLTLALFLFSCTKPENKSRDGYFIYQGEKYEINSLVYEANAAGYTELYFYGGSITVIDENQPFGNGPMLWMSLYHFESSGQDNLNQAYINVAHVGDNFDLKKMELSDTEIIIDLNPKTNAFTIDMTAKCDGEDFKLHSTGVLQKYVE